MKIKVGPERISGKAPNEQKLILVYPGELIALFSLIVSNAVYDIIIPVEYAGIGANSFALLYIASLLYYSTKLVRACKDHIWTPLFWFRVSSAVYLGIGTVVVYVFDENTYLYLRSFYAWSDSDVLKLVRIFAAFSLVVLAAASVVSVRNEGPSRYQLNFNSKDDRTIFLCSLIFLTFGGILRYGVFFPDAYGLLNFHVPAVFLKLSQAYLAGLFLIILFGLRKSPSVLCVGLGLSGLDFLAGALAFEKDQMILTIMFSGLAFVYHQINFARILFIIGLIYFVLSPGQSFVHYGRSEVAQVSTGGRNVASLDLRIKIARSYFSDQSRSPSAVAERNPFLRISYVAPAAFFVDRYDSGRPGNSFEHIIPTIIPRVLWPSKPDTAVKGLEYYRLIRGTGGASLGITHPAEAYYSFGWWGLMVFVPAGLFLGALSRFALRVVRSHQWIMMPAVLIGMNIGYRVDGHVVADYFGGAVMFLAAAGICWVAQSVLLGGSEQLVLGGRSQYRNVPRRTRS